jgi:glycosyltransferase involved in cell wall biosynthesis
MPSDTPLVTIAIPTLNRPGFLRLAVQSALAQTHSNIEVLVSDNASEDAAADVLAAFAERRLRIFRQNNRLSMCANWNFALQGARGEYFLLLSDDDLLEHTAVEEMVARFKATPAVGLVFCRGEVIDSDGRRIYLGNTAPSELSAGEMILRFFRSELDLWPCSLMFRRCDMAEYPEGFPLGADAAAWIKVVTLFGSAAFVPRVLTRYRVHANTTVTTPLRTWYIENLRLAEFAIESLQEHGRGNQDLYERIRVAVRRLNARITAGFIANSWRASRGVALGVARQHASQFASAYGILVLIKSVIAASVPRSAMNRMVALSRMVKQKTSSSLDRTRDG